MFAGILGIHSGLGLQRRNLRGSMFVDVEKVLNFDIFSFWFFCFCNFGLRWQIVCVLLGKTIRSWYVTLFLYLYLFLLGFRERIKNWILGIFSKFWKGKFCSLSYPGLCILRSLYKISLRSNVKILNSSIFLPLSTIMQYVNVWIYFRIVFCSEFKKSDLLWSFFNK